jgi:hypothetical protein
MKKFFLFVVLVLLLVGTTKSVSAVFTQQDFQNSIKTPDINLSKWIGGEAGVIDNIAAGLTRAIIGDLPEAHSALRTYPSSGALGGIANLIAVIYANPPASSVEYFADLGKNLGLVKPAYAQGIGFEGLKPILPLWKAFRNIAYVFFTIVFVIMGFAIMFRVKLNPQTVISVQNAIPRVVIVLILVTFSYAIAGLLIDLMYVISAIIVGVINPGGFLNNLVNLLREKNIGGGNEAPNFLVFQLLFMGKGLEYAYTLASTFLNPAVILADILNAPQELTDLIQKLTVLIPNLSGGAILLTLILAIILLLAFFKLLLSLLKAYISVIISIILGPLQIMLGVLPGQSSFGNWLRNLIANLAVFPTVITMMALTSKIVELTGEGRLWVPPPLTPPTIAGTGGTSSARMIGAMIAYGMLLLMPKAAEIVQKTLRIQVFPYGTAIGEALGPLRTSTRMAILYPVQYTSQQISAAYQSYAAASGGKPPPPWIARAKAATDVLRTLGLIK